MHNGLEGKIYWWVKVNPNINSVLDLNLSTTEPKNLSLI